MYCLLGLRALHYAALKGSEAGIEMLCLHGAAIDEPTDFDGSTALHLAAQYGHYSAVCPSDRLSVCLFVYNVSDLGNTTNNNDLTVPCAVAVSYTHLTLPTNREV